MLHQFIFWLRGRKLLNLFLVFGYFGFIIYMHRPITMLSNWVQQRLSLNIYNLTVQVIYAVFLLLLFIFLIYQFKKYTANISTKLFYFFITIALIIIHSFIMFEMKIEIIHSLEFTLLTFLLFPLVNRFGAAVFFTLPFMLADEWYQYIILDPNWNTYFDFNDVTMDIYGSGLTVIVLSIAGVSSNSKQLPFYKRIEFVSLLALLLCFAIAVKTCVIAFYQTDVCNNTWLLLRETNMPGTFWEKFPNRDVVYHVLKPIEGVTMITSLLLFYFGLDSFRKEKYKK